MLLAEYARDTTSFDGFVLVEAGVALATLQLAWRQQERIRLVPLLALATLFHAAWIALHLGLSLPNDYDSSIVYRREGEALLHGHYPRSEYPVGAVLLFAFEAWIGNGVTRTANAFAMMPFQFATVLCVWGLRTRFSSWFAVLIALWPANMLWFELRFDLVPAACLCAGLLLVLRRHWVWAGIAFGLGTVFKWSPSLAFLVIAVWLIRQKPQAAIKLTSAFLLTVLGIYIPFLAWHAHTVLAAYTIQGGRHITPESLWFLPLRASGLAEIRGGIARPADAPAWADLVASGIQTAILLILVVSAAKRRVKIEGAVAIAALAPAVFLLTNRIFSPQFFVVIVAACAIGGGLVVRNQLEQLALGLTIALAALANLLIFFRPHVWLAFELISAGAFALALIACGSIFLGAVRRDRRGGAFSTETVL